MFPFYWAIVSSLKTGSELFQVDFWPSDPAWDNYVAVFREQPFGRNILNSILVAVSTVLLSLALAVAAAYALGRIQFRGRTTLLIVVLGVSMFPQIAVLSGMFELIRWLGLYNSLLGADALLHDLHPAVHGLGADDLHARAAQGAGGGGDRRWRQAATRS